MTEAERKIRFDIALEMAQKVYNDYCHDQNKTREQAYEFCCVVQEMIRFSAVLDGEVKEAKHE